MRRALLSALSLVALLQMSCEYGRAGSPWVGHVPEPDFTLALTSSRFDVAQGSSNTIPIVTTAINPTSPPPNVTITVVGLPFGMTADTVVVPAGSVGGVTVHASGTAPQTVWKDATLSATLEATSISGAKTQTVPVQVRVRGPAGTPDATFGSAGFSTPLAGTFQPRAFAVTGTEAGDVTLAGSGRCGNDGNGNPTGVCLAIYGVNPDGSFHFGGGWAAVPNDTGSATGRQILTLPDGRYLIAGETSSPQAQLVLVRFSATGLYDSGFGVSGGARTATGYGSAGVALDSTGYLQLGASGGGSILSHVDFAGQPGGYGTNGSTQFNWIGPGETSTGLVIDTAGRAVVIGNLAGGGFGIARFDAGGHPDSAFNASGFYTSTAGLASGVRILAGGTIVVCGSSSDSGHAQATLFGFRSDGSVNAAFGTAGRVVLPTTETTQCVAEDVDGENRILLTGSASPGGILVARVLPDGTIDGSFSDGAAYRLYHDGLSPSAIAVADSRVLITGTVQGPNVYLFVLRLWD